MNLEFLHLGEVIRRLADGKPVLYISNPGNWGDALIRAGSLAFFNKFHISYEELPLVGGTIVNNARLLKAKLRDQLVVVAGGGAWCSHYSHLANSISRMQERFAFSRVLVLPSTYDREYNIKNVTFFRRDEVISKDNMPKANFCHDMAFFLGNITTSKTPENKEGYFFRTDVEASGKNKLRSDNVDLSANGNESDDISGFFSYLSNYETINTDRLHVSIAGSLLGRNVRLYEGSYLKNKSIYLSSMKEKYGNTTYIDSPSEG